MNAIKTLLENTPEDEHERLEALMEAVVSEMETDDEPWSKKGRQLLMAVAANNAENVLISLCGWSLDSLAKRAMIIRDPEMMFHDEPVEASIEITLTSGECISSDCMVDPATHEVSGFAKELFDRDEAEIGEVSLSLEPISDIHTFICVKGKDADSITDPGAFWYNPDHYSEDVSVDSNDEVV